ncbi:MAG TPA: beta-L-arabinofuranosidase domain-containing protein [Armatimonadota bacterium]|jgi:hypothetical protein
MTRRDLLAQGAAGVGALAVGELAAGSAGARETPTAQANRYRHAARPSQETPKDVTFRLGGWLGKRLEANTRNWLLPTPDANPAMLQILRDRDRTPPRDLVPWAGEFAGKYLTSAVLALRLTGDRGLRNHLAGFVKDIIAAQAEDGYLGPFPAATRMVGPGLWDLWGQYHCMLGLLLYARETGDAAALSACRRVGDLFCRTFLEDGKRVVQAGSEEMNESAIHVFLLLHEETGEGRYLRLAREIERDWQTPPSGDYLRWGLAGKPFHQCPKPRWESLPSLQALAELHFITGDAGYRAALESLWHSIAAGDRHNTGGFTSGEQATGNPYDPRPIETCCTVAWSALTVDMLRMTGSSEAADELELSLFNALLGAQNETGRWWTYNTPMDGDRKASAHDIVFQARAGSPELNCCSVNGPRGLAMVADWAVMEAEDGLALNYYGPSDITVGLPDGGTVTLRQRTRYPLDGRVRLSVEPDRAREMTLRLRIPRWSANTRVTVPGQRLPSPEAGGYLELRRRWSPGDLVELDLDFTPHLWEGERECAGRVSVYRGPLLLAHDPRYDDHAPDALPSIGDAPRILGGVAWRQAPVPFGLWKLGCSGGETLALCDFASAGSTGTPYRTWLPK